MQKQPLILKEYYTTSLSINGKLPSGEKDRGDMKRRKQDEKYWRRKKVKFEINPNKAKQALREGIKDLEKI